MAHDEPRATGPTKLVIRNIALVLSGALERPILDADTIIAVNGKIAGVGRARDLDTEGATTIVDANGTTVTPGLIDIVRDARLARLRHQRFAERLERLALMGIEKAERHIAGPRLARRHQNFDPADGESQRAQRRALDKAASTNRHGHLLPAQFSFSFAESALRNFSGITG